MADMLATPEDLASLLQQDLDRSTSELLIECATAVVQAAAGQRIVQVVDDEVTLYLDEYDDSEYLVLPQRPITNVSAVSIGPDPVDDFYPQFNRNRIWRADGWRSLSVIFAGQPSTVTVTYTHGYPPGHQKLQLARSTVLMLAATGYSNPDGAMREQIDDYMIQYNEMTDRIGVDSRLVRSLRQHYGTAVGSARLIRR